MEELKKISEHVNLLDRIDWSKNIFESLDVSENTRTEYKYRIDLFIDFVKRNGFHRNTYLDFKRFLQKRTDLAVASKNKYLITARIYLKELHRLGYIPLDITAGIKSFKQTRQHKKEGLNETDVQAVVSYLHQLSPTPRNMRVKAILCLLTLQGFRQCEVIRLNVKDIDFVSQRAFIQGKGRDDLEAVDLHPQTCRILKEYLLSNRISDGAVFTSTSNNSRNERLTTKSVRNLINPILKQLEIDKSVHGFRHYFTTKLIQSYNGDLLTIAKYTRHKSIETLQIYNDSIKRKADLPRYYETFKNIGF